jgi:hypothetical protein
MERHVLTSSLPTTAVALLLVASGLLAANTISAGGASSVFWATDTDGLKDDTAGKSRSRHRIARHRRLLA